MCLGAFDCTFEKPSAVQAWAAFYGVPYLPLYEEAKAYHHASPEAFIALGGDRGRLLSTDLYKSRMRMVSTRLSLPTI